MRVSNATDTVLRNAAVVIALAGNCLGAQVLMGGTASRDGLRFSYETRVEPELPGRRLTGVGSGGVIVGDGTHFYHRYLSDKATKRYFGYDLAIEALQGDRYRVTLKPLSLTAEKLGLQPPNDWTAIPLPAMPAPQVLRRADTIALELFVHPDTGQKLVDYITVQGDSPGVRLPEGAPRDYTLDDVPLTLSGARVTWNGKAVHRSGGGYIRGEAVYAYLPGHGRFVFSIAPHTALGFQRAGEIRGQRLTITSGSDKLTIDCDAPIAPGSGVYYVYAHHDATWRPAQSAGEVHMGASSARALVRR